MSNTRNTIALSFKPDISTTKILTYTPQLLSITSRTVATYSTFFCQRRRKVNITPQEFALSFRDEASRLSFERALVTVDIEMAKKIISELPGPYNNWRIYFAVVTFLNELNQHPSTADITQGLTRFNPPSSTINTNEYYAEYKK